MKSRKAGDLKSTTNIGATIEKYLHEIGIFTLADLEKTTSAETFKKIRGNYPERTIPVCYYLYSLEGALLNMHWNDIPPERKEELRKRIQD